MLKNRSFKCVLVATVLCFAMSLFSSAVAPGPQPLEASVESLVMGGSTCSESMEGLFLGMSFGAVFGCVWCIGVGLGAKLIGAFC